MRAAIVMPTLHRIEMLALSLEKLSKVCGIESSDVQIYLDKSDQQKVDEAAYVRDTYFPSADLFLANEHPSAPSGCWNILNAIKAGYNSNLGPVYLVEEDIFCYPNFLEWHQSVQSDCQPVASCGRLIERYGNDYYTNPGSCLSRSLLNDLVPHICDGFFRDREGYLSEHFPIWPEASALDDGLIRRVLKQIGGKIVFPDKPVAAHQGFYYYQKHVACKTSGSIQERIVQVRAILENVNPQADCFRDFEPYDPSRETS